MNGTGLFGHPAQSKFLKTRLAILTYRSCILLFELRVPHEYGVPLVYAIFFPSWTTSGKINMNMISS